MQEVRDDVADTINTLLEDAGETTRRAADTLNCALQRRREEIDPIPQAHNHGQDENPDVPSTGNDDLVLPSPLTTMENIKAKARGGKLDYRVLDKDGITKTKDENETDEM